MIQRKYTLPRHTILAKQGARTGAFLVDLAIALAFVFTLVFAVFRPIFKNRVNADLATIEKEQLNSGLYIKDDGGEVKRISGKSEYTEFFNSLEYFYFHYMPGENIKEGLEPSKYPQTFTVEWFNENILEITEDNSYPTFEYVKTDGVIDTSKIGVRIEGSSDDVANKLLQQKYVDAIIYVFNNIENVKKAGADYMFISTMQFVVSILISGAIFYIVLPWILKDGQTLGKKFFKLGLANSDGYKFTNTRLLMRFVPLAVVDLSLFFLIGVNLYITLTIILIIFLVSFALAMSSPKRMSLHDITARTIVVDLKNSKLFPDSIEETKYVLKEDNLLWEENETNDEGEEPELKYEK